MEQKLNDNGKKRDNGVTVLVERALLVAGNVALLSGAGAPAAIVLFSTGIAMTLGGSVRNAIHARQEKMFKDKRALLARLSNAPDLDGKPAENEDGLAPSALTLMGDKLAAYQQLVAHTKLFSLMHHVLKKSGHKEAKAREDHLTKILATGKKSRWRGSTLLQDELNMMSQLWEKFSIDEKSIFLHDAPHNLRKWMIQGLRGQEASEVSSKLDLTKELQQRIKQSKTNSQFLRHEAALEIVTEIKNLIHIYNKFFYFCIKNIFLYNTKLYKISKEIKSVVTQNTRDKSLSR